MPPQIGRHAKGEDLAFLGRDADGDETVELAVEPCRDAGIGASLCEAPEVLRISGRLEATRMERGGLFRIPLRKGGELQIARTVLGQRFYPFAALHPAGAGKAGQAGGLPGLCWRQEWRDRRPRARDQ